MPSARPLALLLLAAPVLHGCEGDVRDLLPWRGFHAAGSSMEPTLPKGTRFTATKVQPAGLRRGDIVVVRKGAEDWVVRLVALPGDRVAMVDGKVVLNGEIVPLRLVGTRSIDDGYRTREYTVFRERLPGEARPHRILDAGVTPLDDSPEVALGDDEYFLLGDHRDHAADSRLPVAGFGLGIVNATQIRWRVELD